MDGYQLALIHIFAYTVVPFMGDLHFIVCRYYNLFIISPIDALCLVCNVFLLRLKHQRDPLWMISLLFSTSVNCAIMYPFHNQKSCSLFLFFSFLFFDSHFCSIFLIFSLWDSFSASDFICWLLCMMISLPVYYKMMQLRTSQMEEMNRARYGARGMGDSCLLLVPPLAHQPRGSCTSPLKLPCLS